MVFALHRVASVKIHWWICRKRPRHSYSDAGFIMRTSRRLICKWELNPQFFLLQRNVLTFWLLQIFAVSALWSQQRITISQPFDYKSNALPLCYAGRLKRKRVRWAVSISRILDGVTQPWIRTTNRSARATELALRVFHWWGRYCLHLTFNACLRTHGPGDGNRNHIRGLEDRYSSRWTTPSYISWFLSQPCINIISRFSRKIKFSWCLRLDSNQRRIGYEPNVLPTELPRHKTNFSFLLLLVAEVCIFYESWLLYLVFRHQHQ